MAKKSSDCYLGGTVKVSRFERMLSGAARVLALLLTLILVSCAGGSSSKVTSDDEDSSSSGDWSSADGTDWEVEELDLTDTDGDGVPDYMEEPYGTEDNPFEYPDVYSQLEDDPAFENDGYPDASDYVDLATSAGTTMASYMLARGIAKNSPLCVVPTGVGNIINNGPSTDNTALTSAGTMETATKTASIVFKGGVYTRKTLSGGEPTGTEIGTYTITAGYIRLDQTGLSCGELYKASVAEMACTNCTNHVTIIDPYDNGQHCINLESNQITTYSGWKDPIDASSLSSLSMSGTDVKTAATYSDTFIHLTYAVAGECDEVASDKPRTGF